MPVCLSSVCLSALRTPKPHQTAQSPAQYLIDCLSVRLTVMPVWMSVSRSVCISVCPSLCLLCKATNLTKQHTFLTSLLSSVCQYSWTVCLDLSVCVYSVYLPVHLFFLSVCLSLFLTVSLSHCLAWSDVCPGFGSLTVFLSVLYTVSGSPTCFISDIHPVCPSV